MFTHLSAVGMLLEEVNDFDNMLSTHDQLLKNIAEAGRQLAYEYAVTGDRSHKLGKIRPRTWHWRLSHSYKLKLWRIEPLYHPLWLGEDGLVYRGYGPWADTDWPSYWMRAELELRSDSGLKRVLGALQPVASHCHGDVV